MVGFTVSRILAEPFYEIAQRYNPQVFALSDREKIEGAKEVLTLTPVPLAAPHLQHGARPEALAVLLHDMDMLRMIGYLQQDPFLGLFAPH